jgi:hypothetical protein
MRCVLAVIAVVAAMPPLAGATPSATLTWYWKNLTTGGTGPGHEAGSGHSIAIWLDLAMSPPIDGIVSGNLVNRGLASLFVDLYSEGNTVGSWFVNGYHPQYAFPGTPAIDGPFTNWGSYIHWEPGDPLPWGRRYDPFHPGAGWAFGGDANYQPHGSIFNSPGTLAAIQAGQFPWGTGSNTFNPLRELWRGLFTVGPETTIGDPMVWTPRTAEASLTSGITLLVRPQGTTDPFTSFTIPFENIDWGTLVIPTIPSPPGLGLLALAGLMAMRRRR